LQVTTRLAIIRMQGVSCIHVDVTFKEEFEDPVKKASDQRKRHFDPASPPCL